MPGVMPSTMARGLPLAARPRAGDGGAGKLLARLSKLLGESVAPKQGPGKRDGTGLFTPKNPLGKEVSLGAERTHLCGHTL